MQTATKSATVLRQINSQETPLESNMEYLDALLKYQYMRLKARTNGHGASNQLSLAMDCEPTNYSKADLSADFSSKVNESRANGVLIPFEDLLDACDLSLFEREILRLLVALNIDWKLYTYFRQVYGCNEINVGAITACLSTTAKHTIDILDCFNRQSNLIRKELIEMDTVRSGGDESFLKNEIKLSGYIVDCALDGSAGISGIIDCVKEVKGFTEMDNVVLAGSLRNEVIQLVDSYIKMLHSSCKVNIDSFMNFGGGLALLFHGPSGTGKTMLAKAMANHTGRPLFTINPKYMDYHGVREEIIFTIYREARKKGGIVFFDECDDLFQEDSPESRALLNEIENHPVVTILITNNPEKLDPALSRRIMKKVRFSLPDYEHRKEIWEVHIPDTVQVAEPQAIAELAKKYRFSGGQIRNSVQMAVSLSFNDSNGSEKVILSSEVLEHAAEAQSVGLIVPQEDSLFMDDNVENLEFFSTDEKGRIEKIRSILQNYSPPEERLALFLNKIGSNNTSLKVLITCQSFYRGVKAASYILKDVNQKITCKHIKSILNEILNEKEEILYPRRRRGKHASVFDAIKPVESVLVIGDDENTIENAINENNNVSQMWLDLERHLANISSPVIYITSATRIPKAISSRWFHYRINLQDESPQEREIIWKQFLSVLGIDNGVADDIYPEICSLENDHFKNLLNTLCFEVQSRKEQITASDIKNITNMILDKNSNSRQLFGR